MGRYTELYAAAEAFRKAKRAEERASRKAKENPKHWLRSFKALDAAKARYEAAKAAG